MTTIENMPPLACRELVELVTDYFEDRLSPTDRARFERHISGCDACTIYLEQMRLTLRALGSIPEATISDRARETLLAAFSDVRSGGAQ
jgi:anti-sigma factor RsiW